MSKCTICNLTAGPCAAHRTDAVAFWAATYRSQVHADRAALGLDRDTMDFTNMEFAS